MSIKLTLPSSWASYPTFGPMEWRSAVSEHAFHSGSVFYLELLQTVETTSLWTEQASPILQSLS